MTTAVALSTEHRRALNNLPKTVPGLSRVHAGGANVELGDVLGALVDVLSGALADDTAVLTASIAELNILDGVTTSAAELNLIDGLTADFADLNTVALGMGDTETILVAGAASVVTGETLLSAASGAYAVTLAAPPAGSVGRKKVIRMSVAGAAITIALTNVIGGTAATTASFDAVNETLTLVSVGTKWMVEGQAGVTLS